VGIAGATTGSSCPWPRANTGARLGGNKAPSRLDAEFLDWALAEFSGDGAAADLYDGPFCLLSAVDKRRYKRLLYDVFDHAPDHDDSRAFLGRLQTALRARDLTLLGITPDGAALSPTPLAEVLRGGPHPLGQLHSVKASVTAVGGVVSRARKRLAATQPTLRRGRPSTPVAKQAARTKQRLAAPRAALCPHRYRFVQRPVSKTERKIL
jgi:hypothetical protein